jgi:hypothetical protein
MQFDRVTGPVEDLLIWSVTSNGFSFVISFETRSGAGLRGRHGFLRLASDPSKQKRRKGRWLTLGVAG